jgi:hypothetical protein
VHSQPVKGCPGCTTEPPEACNHARPIGGPCYGCAELPVASRETLESIQEEANKLQQAIQRLPEPPEEDAG